jgi:DNA-binding PadR family transcriptional regulator
MRQGPMGGFGPGVRGPGFQMRQGPMGGFGMRPGRMRAQRGDVKAAILSLVKEAPRHGYEIISEIEQRSNGAWKPSPGSIYPTLQALEDQGLVVGSDSEGKRVYSITEAGDEYLENLPGGGVRWEQFQDGPLGGVMDLKEQMFQLGAAVMQVAAQSDRDQTETVAKLLTETKKKIYRLLAGDEL